MSTPFQAELLLSTNVPEAVKKAVEGIDSLTVAQQKAQAKIAAIIAKGEPQKALEQQLAKDFVALENLARKDVKLREQVEKEKAALVAKFANDRVQLELKAQEAVKQAAIQSVKNTDVLQNQVKALKEPLSQVASGANALGAAFGGAGGQATQAITSIVGAFGAGGPAAVALAGTVAVVGLLVTKYGDLRASVEESRKTWRDAQSELSKTSMGQLETSQEAIAKLRMKLAGGNVDVNTLRSQSFAAGGAASDAEGRVSLQQTRVANIERMRAENAAAVAAWRASSGHGLDDKSNAGRPVLSSAASDEDLAREKQALADAISYRDTQRAIAGSLNEQADLLLRVARAEKARTAATKAKSGAKSEEESWAGSMTTGRDELELMGGMFGESPKQHADRIERDQKKQDKIFKAGFGGLGAATRDATSHLQKVQFTKGEFDNEQKKLAEDATKAWADAGINSAENFADAFVKVMDSKNPKEFFGALLKSAAGFLPLLMGGPAAGIGGSLLGLVGGLFERGGGTYGYSLPSGRGGLGTGNADDMLTRLHKREVVMREDVADSFPGGYPQAVRVGMGYEPVPGSGGGGQVVNVYASALDNRSVLDGVAGPIEKAHVRRIVTKQGQLLAAHQRKAIAVPGHS